ncbi:MAG: helix-turn-helix domain-containing protein [Dehalococcoidia bacterium]
MAANRTTPESFGSRLRDLRRRSRLSQRQLADIVGLSQRKVSDIETGRRPPVLLPEQYVQLTDVLQVSLAELFGYELPETEATRRRFDELLRLAPDLRDREISALVVVARQLIAARHDPPPTPPRSHRSREDAEPDSPPQSSPKSLRASA